MSGSFFRIRWPASDRMNTNHFHEIGFVSQKPAAAAGFSGLEGAQRGSPALALRVVAFGEGGGEHQRDLGRLRGAYSHLGRPTCPDEPRPPALFASMPEPRPGPGQRPS